MKIIKRLLATIALFVLVFISGLITLVFSPQALFANKIEHQMFSIYSSDTFDDEYFKIRLDHAYEITMHSELFDPDYHFDILLADQHFFNDIESLQGKGVLARATAGYITIKIPIYPKLNKAVGPRSTVDLTYLLVHEMIHNLQTNRYGLINMSPINMPPLWKVEGYAEYISRREKLTSENYDLKLEIDRFLHLYNESKDGSVEVVEGHFMPVVYYKGRLMVEYLVQEKGMTYDEILNDDRTEDDVYEAMMKWREEK